MAGTTIERRYRMYGIRVYEHEVPSTKAQLAIREHEHGAPLAEHEELEIWMPVSLDPTAKKVAKCSRKRTAGKLPRSVGMTLASVGEQFDDVWTSNHVAVSPPRLPPMSMSLFSKFLSRYSNT